MTLSAEINIVCYNSLSLFDDTSKFNEYLYRADFVWALMKSAQLVVWYVGDKCECTELVGMNLFEAR